MINQSMQKLKSALPDSRAARLIYTCAATRPSRVRQSERGDFFR